MKITYIPPQGESRVVTYMGVEFFAGHEQDLDPKKYAGLFAKARGNRHFTVEEAPRRGRPPKVEDESLSEGEGA